MPPPPPLWFTPLDITMQLITGVIALAVALYAYRGYSWIRSQTLFCIFLAFFLLTLAFLISGLTMSFAYIEQMTYDQTVGPGLLMQMGFSFYYGLSIVAFGLLLYTYIRQPMGLAMAAMGPIVIFSSPSLEMILFILVGLIIIALIFREERPFGGNSGLVMVSFVLLLLSHMFILFTFGYQPMYFVAKAFQICGFAIMGFVLYRLGRAK